MTTPLPPTPSFGQRFWQVAGNFFKFVLRLIFVILFAVVLGAGVYFGVTVGLPALDRAYVQPVREATAKIARLELQATLTAAHFDARIAGLQARLTALEIQGDTAKNALAELATQLATLTPLGDQQAALAARLDELDAALAALDEALAAQAGGQETALAALSRQVDAHGLALATLEAQVRAEDIPAAQVYTELQLVKAMALLTRSQVYIYQSNPGLAAQDTATARALLFNYRETASPEDQARLDPLLARLDLALGNLPASPSLALADIQVAWEMISGEFVPEPALSPTPGPPPTSTP